jgi:predicted ferric reductase
MMGVSLIDVSAVIALIAMCLVSLNFLIGLLMAVRYDPRRQWPHISPPWPFFRIHKWTGYIALCVAAAHPGILLLARTQPKFSLGDLLLPIHSPYQRLYNSLGALAFYCFAVVIVSSYFRARLPLKLWKRLHYTGYCGAALMFVHGTLINQYLEQGMPDLLDGEKVLIEACCLILIMASIWRFRGRARRPQGSG